MNEIEQRQGVSVLLEEQETHVSFTRLKSECIVWTSDKTTITKLDKLVKVAPEVYQVRAVELYKGKVVHKEYLITDKTLISFRHLKTTRVLTEEQKQQRRELLAKNRVKV